jgi:serine/threonine-protein phosphatase 2A regulatory subunit B'
VHGDVSSAIIILRDAVCGERSAFGGSGIERIIKVLAGDKLSKGGFIFRRLEEVLELTQPQEFTKTMIPLFQQISRCVESAHFQVSERALFLWNNDYIVNLVAQIDT